jgi:hypothetical protein
VAAAQEHDIRVDRRITVTIIDRMKRREKVKIRMNGSRGKIRIEKIKKMKTEYGNSEKSSSFNRATTNSS